MTHANNGIYEKQHIYFMYFYVAFAYSYYISVIWKYKIIVWWCSAKYMTARVEEVLERIYRDRIIYRKTIKNITKPGEYEPAVNFPSRICSIKCGDYYYRGIFRISVGWSIVSYYVYNDRSPTILRRLN